MARKDSRSPLARLLSWSGRFLAVLATLVAIYVGVTKLCDSHGLAKSTKALLVYSTVGLAGCFFLAWLGIYVKDLFSDTPPPGFNRVMAEKLCALAIETLPGVPNKKRSKVVLAVGLSIICVKLTRIAFSLNYFATRRFRPLRDELARETLYHPEELSHMSTMAGLLHQDFMLFLQLAEPVVKFCTGFGTASELTDMTVLSNTAKRLEDNSNLLTELVVQGRGFFDGHQQKVKFKPNEAKTIKQRLDHFIADLDEDMIKLDELRKPTIATEKYYHSLLLEALPR